MGSPLGPVLANLFMGYHEGNWIENYKKSRVIFYNRYVDDIICLFDTEEQAEEFLNYLNDQHPNIKFTMEKQENNSLSF